MDIDMGVGATGTDTGSEEATMEIGMGVGIMGTDSEAVIMGTGECGLIFQSGSLIYAVVSSKVAIFSSPMGLQTHVFFSFPIFCFKFLKYMYGKLKTFVLENIRRVLH
jgi:hypothetical protein